MKALIRRYALVNASMAAMFGLMMPVLYLALLDKGVSIVQFGTLVAAFTLSSVAFDLPSGALADIIGRKRVFLLGEVAMFLSTAGFWLASSLAALCGVMMLSGMSRAFLTGPLDALLVEQMRDEFGGDIDGNSILSAQAKVGAVSMLSLGGAAILGGFVPIWMNAMLNEHGWVGYYEVNFVLMLPLICIHFILTTKLIYDPRLMQRNVIESFEKKLGVRKVIEKAVFGALRSPDVLSMFVIQMMSGAALEMVDAFWQPRLATFIDAKSGSWLFGLLCSVGFIAMGIGQKSSVRMGALFRQHYVRLLFVLQLVLGLAVVLFALQNRVYGFFAAFVLVSAIGGSMVAPMITVVQENAEDDVRTTLLSMKSVVQQVGAMLGVLFGSHIAQTYGIGIAWLGAGAVVVVSCLWSVVYIPMRSSRTVPGQITEEEGSY